MSGVLKLEFTVTNTDKRLTPKYRITNTYITDPIRNTLLIRTRFQSLDGGIYQLYLLENPTVAGGGANNNGWWDKTNCTYGQRKPDGAKISSCMVQQSLLLATNARNGAPSVT